MTNIPNFYFGILCCLGGFGLGWSVCAMNRAFYKVACELWRAVEHLRHQVLELQAYEAVRQEMQKVQDERENG